MGPRMPVGGDDVHPGYEPVHLDHNATTPVAREAADAMWPYVTEVFGNPSSTSRQGVRARRAVDRAREQVAALIGAGPDEIVFTSGGTESNNLAIRGSAALTDTRVAVCSRIEHPATAAPLAHLADTHGWRVHELDVDGDARILPSAIPRGAIGLGTLILAHNEIGTVQPMRYFADAVHAAGGLVHADAAQAVGKIDVAVDDLGVDLLSVAGHKLYAPKGVGALFVRRGTALAPVLRGAGQEGGVRPGTENVAGIVGLGEAAELAAELLDREARRQADLRDRLWERLSAAVPDLVRITPRDGVLPNTLMVAAPGTVGADVLAAAPEVAASTGSACHSGSGVPSGALGAMGVEPRAASGALRLSVGRSTAETDVDLAVTALTRAILGGAPAE